LTAFGSRFSAPVSRAIRTTAGRERVPELVVQRSCAKATRQPQPTPIGSASVASAERAQRRGSGATDAAYPSVKSGHEAVEEQVGRARVVYSVRRLGGLGHLAFSGPGPSRPANMAAVIASR